MSFVGKIYDDIQIKPGSRVDRYWGAIQIRAKNVGVEQYNTPYYTKAGEAIKHFRLYSLEFGNWMNQSDRAHFMYATLVTLRDMAEVLGIPHSRMGIKKKLSIAFGSRGRGGRAAAFYQPGYAVINLTKTHGRHTFCHEYAHAIDFISGAHSDPRSARKTPSYTNKRKGTIAWNMEKAIELTLWNADNTPSSYHKWLDKESAYYNRRAEIWARMVESYFVWQFRQKGIFNTWGVSSGFRADMPAQNLIERAAPYIKKVFHAAT